ncbi:hypothetical protein DICVIV_09113 [Dictyocaulus viviparus]|uniref:Uncharacterized protein n=1 Tax=Dictyocaulus viviparus TaxID=29172 RepID=A0A0D8XJV8_DICVI|nr:hypothetical protein DICVIV_09113 [Dictyocaulus viviparus]
MFHVPCLGVLTSRCILDECRTNHLLEEVDESDITFNLASFPGTSFPCLFTLSFLTLPFVILYSCKRLLFYSDISILFLDINLYSCAIISTFVVLWFVVKWRLKVLIHSLNALECSARKANRLLRERETLAFGLGLQSLRVHSACRLQLLVCCRETILLMSAFSKSLISTDFMFEESERLLSVFYTDEMYDLVHADISSDSFHLSQRGIEFSHVTREICESMENKGKSGPGFIAKHGFRTFEPVPLIINVIRNSTYRYFM